MQLNKMAIGVALTSLLMAGTAQAHYLWIETVKAEARVYFGEPDVLLKEKSPGKLDNIPNPQAFLQNQPGAAPVNAEVQRKGEYFLVPSNGKATSIFVVEESVGVKDLTKYGLGFAKSNYYARYGKPVADKEVNTSLLPLDLKQVSEQQYRVLYRGQPLAHAKLEVIAPNTWMQEHKTDVNGVVEINTPWRGQYVLHVLHVDKTPGEFGGSKYESLRNHFTYSFIRAKGADPGPAVAPKQVED